MLQQTLERLEGLEQVEPIIVCNDEHRFLVAEQLRQLGIDNATIILEPEGKNTAPAIALAAMLRRRLIRSPCYWCSQRIITLVDPRTCVMPLPRPLVWRATKISDLWFDSLAS